MVVFSKPTYGLDVKTTATVRDLIRRLAAGGGAALVISTDLDELLDIADRIAVLSRAASSAWCRTARAPRRRSAG